jgi:phosphoserine phosphatase
MNLVVQGPGLGRIDLEDFVALVRPSALERMGEHAARLRDAHPHDGIAGLCERHRLDYAWIPVGRRFADLKLVAMDMDSTLITIECIDEIGGMLGIKDRIAAITASAMRGEIDYPESLRQRVALLAGLEESALERVYREKLQLSAGAEALVAACRGQGIHLLLVSGGFTFFTEKLKARLGLDETLSNVLEIERGRLTGRVIGRIVDAGAKAEKFREVARKLGATREQTLAVGDGANDLLMMAEAGTSVAYRAKPVVRARASCAISHNGLDAILNLFEV